MTDTRHLTRLYVFAITLLVFFVTWAVVAAHPWATKPTSYSQAAALQQRIQLQTQIVRRLQSAKPSPNVSAAPRIVTLPPLTITRTS